MSDYWIEYLARHDSWRPADTGDAEFEEVALRVAEAGALNELFERWQDAPHASAAERLALDAMFERISEVLGRSVEPRYLADRRSTGECPPWWDAADEAWMDWRKL